ncbi:MAG: methyl-accepting chemotaxis protein, partial [Oscillospiraceae bacterium]|nr:methyl-accepting chemotaxis protein [Oscillospiraceae bacterium]
MFKKYMGSIKGKLTIVIILIMAIPLSLVVIASSVMSYNSNIDSVWQYNDAKAQLIEYEIASVLDQNMQALQAFASAPSTIAYIMQKNGAAIDGVAMPDETLLKQMRTIDAALGDGNTTIVSGNKGMQLLRTEGEPVDIADREYYKMAMSGTVYVSNVQQSKSTGSMITTFAVPVYGEDGSVIGTVQRNYNLSDFHDILASEVFESKYEIVIVDRDGNVVAHSGHELDPNASELESQAGNPFYTDSRAESAVNGSYISKWQGDTWMISWVKEPKTGWVVASCRVQAVALSKLINTMLVMVGIGVAALIAAIIISIRFASMIAKPIQSVSESVNGLTHGDLMSRFDKQSADRNDEIGQIAKNSIGLAEKLQDVIGRSKQMAGGLLKAGEELSDSSSQASQAAGQVSVA